MTTADLMKKGDGSTAVSYNPNGGEVGAELWARTSLSGPPLPVKGVDNGDGTSSISSTSSDAAPTTGTHSNVTVGTGSTAVLSSNSSRLGFTLYNHSGETIFVEFGATAAVASSLPLTRGSYYSYNYKGVVTAIAVAGSASLRVVEFT